MAGAVLQQCPFPDQQTKGTMKKMTPPPADCPCLNPADFGRLRESRMDGAMFLQCGEKTYVDFCVIHFCVRDISIHVRTCKSNDSEI